MRTLKGKVQYSKKGLKIILSYDFCLYYRYLIRKANWNLLVPETPRFGAHINIWNPAIHKKLPKNTQKWNKKEVQISYDPESMEVRKSKKGFWVWWFDCHGEDLIKILEETGMKSEFNSINKPHITIGNTKYLCES